MSWSAIHEQWFFPIDVVESIEPLIEEAYLLVKAAIGNYLSMQKASVALLSKSKKINKFFLHSREMLIEVLAIQKLDG